MSTSFRPPALVSDRLRWSAAFCACGVAALLSAAQISLRQTLAGASPAVLEQIALNLVAWLPWVPLSVWVTRTRRGPQPPWMTWILARGVEGHLLLTGFFVYLALFRFAFFPERTGPLGASSLLEQVLREASQFYVTSLGIYVLLVVLATWTRGAQAREEQIGVPPVLTAPAALAPSAEPGSRWLTIRSVGRSERVKVEDIDWIEGDGSYARLHLPGRTRLVRRTLKSLEEELASAGFQRIHRSSIVRLARVRAVRPLGHGDAEVVLEGGETLRVSRSYRPRLDAALGAVG